MLESFSEVEDIIGYKFKDKNLLIRAFTHNSGVKKGTKRSYQNLEFLGDSILSFIIAEALMKRHPSFDEGQLTRMRAAIVSEKPLAETIKKTGLNEFLIMGESETKMGINRNSSVMSDLFESIVGSIYLDGGIKNAKNFILKFLEPKIRLSECNNNNFSMLNEFAGKHSLAVRYEDALNDESALQKQKFEFVVYIDGEEMGKGAGGSKKEAQQMAAKVAYKKLITNK